MKQQYLTCKEPVNHIIGPQQP